MLHSSKSQSSYKNIKNRDKGVNLYDFYSVFIKAINKNPDKVINKKECIKKIIQLKSERENANKKNKFNINSLYLKQRTIKYKEKISKLFEKENQILEIEQEKMK